MSYRLFPVGFFAAVSFSCARAHLGAPDHSLRVMSYNIEYGDKGLDKVITVIRDQHPDIVGLQEVDVHWSSRSNFEDQAALLAKGTGMEYRFARIYETQMRILQNLRANLAWRCSANIRSSHSSIAR